jgi:hypothetical protein
VIGAVAFWLPELTVPALKAPSSAAGVWSALVVFDQLTVSPWWMVMFAGLNA